MSNWRIFPNKGWTRVGTALSGFGKGEGAYGSAYAFDKDTGPFLNGRVSASIQLAGNRVFNGAGVIARADELRSFSALYVVTDDKMPDKYSVRLAAFKLGKLVSIVGLKQLIEIPNRQYHLSLQFFSGDMVGQVLVGSDTHVLNHIVPEVPFQGFCGAVRFYDSSAVVQNMHIERIDMKPILPEESGNAKQEHPFCVFLSHSTADKPVVQKVIARFKNAGISYWIDSEQIMFGDPIVTKIEEGLKKSKFVVVCLSKNLANSTWCRAEYGPILNREFSGNTSRRVIPLSLDGSKDTETIPLLLSDKMRADFTNSANFASFINFLQSS
jgi:hypothetical protein